MLLPNQVSSPVNIKMYSKIKINNVFICFYLLYFHLVYSDESFYEKFNQNDYKLKFERAYVSFANKSFMDVQYNTYKYNRTIAAINATMILHTDLDYDLQMLVQAYKFLSNEYRTFPVHFQINFCKALENNIGGMKACATNCGYLKCPLKKGVKYFLCYCLFDESKMPPLIPSGQFKLQLDGMYKNEKISTLESCFTIYRPIPY